MTNFKIDSKKKKINYRLKFKYNGEEVNEIINLKSLEKEPIILSGSAFDYVAELQLLKSGMLGIRVATVFDDYIVTFTLPELEIKIINEEN